MLSLGAASVFILLSIQMLHMPLLVLIASVILWYFGTFNLTWTLVSVVVTIVSMVSYKGEDPYDSFHVALNASPSEIMSGSRPSTEWLNMGYWKVSKSSL